ncbi:MAG: DUF4397 domain-containing protein [Schleiferiaceae bacterium]|nr:DUF4397 domain-containing protein [Schleiferiaceae bacterium]
MKKVHYFTLSLLLSFSLVTFAQNAKLQVIHNCADALADSVDVYLNGSLAIDNFAFRTATNYLSLPSGVPHVIGIAPKNSAGYADTLVTFTYTLAPGASYVAVADGLLNAAFYSPFKPFNLELFVGGREAASMPNNTDVLVHHGSTDAPAVDVMEIEAGAGTIVNNINYTEFQGYLELPTADYRLAILDSTSSVKVKSYEAPLNALGLDDSALVVIASGFLNPSMNNNGPAFGLFVALPSGGALIPLPESMARVQVIHNSSDAIADSVDVYINGSKAIDNFAYRTATPFIDLPSEVNVNVGIAPKNSMGYADTLVSFNYSLGSNERYIIVADGLVNTNGGYMPFKPFNLEVYPMGREMANTATNTDVLVHHGSTDAPMVDVQEVGIGAGTIVDDLDYSEFQGYLELPTNDYVLAITDGSGNNIVAGYSAPLASLNLDGEALVVVASGFLDPSMNANGPAFGLYVALAGGGDLVELPAVNNIGIEEKNLISVTGYPNPTNGEFIIPNVETIEAVQITALNGQTTTVNFQLNGNDLILDLQGFANGLYTITVTTKENVIVSKVNLTR